MGAEERQKQAQELLRLTGEMLSLAKAGEWAELAVRESERQRLASELFATPVPSEAASTVADCIRRVLDLDQEVLVLVEAGRDEAARVLREANLGREALNAYRRFSR